MHTRSVGVARGPRYSLFAQQTGPIRFRLISIIRALSLVNDGCGILFFAARFVAQSEESPVPQVINVLEVVAAIRQEFICGHIVVHKGVSPLQVGMETLVVVETFSKSAFPSTSRRRVV